MPTMPRSLPLLNPVQAEDVIQVLAMTPLTRRWGVLLAFCGVKQAEFATLIDEYSENLHRWFGAHQSRRYLIAMVDAQRVAEAIGVPLAVIADLARQHTVWKEA